jgi:hypothetical protein
VYRPTARVVLIQVGGPTLRIKIENQNPVGLKILKIFVVPFRRSEPMKPLSSFLALMFLLAPVSAWADECAFLPKEDPEYAAFSTSVDLLKCRELTDKTRNGGKPLTLQQLEEARTKLSDGYRSDTLWGALQIAGINKRVDCMIAIGDYRTCHCLGERLPVRVSFVDYLRVVTSAPGVGAAQFGVSQAEFSKLTGILWSVRDQCIAGR